MKILMVASEVVPFVKTGGLADVVSSLALALAFQNHDVRIVMPRYLEIQYPMNYATDFAIEIDGTMEEAIIRENTYRITKGKQTAQVQVYFVDNFRLYHHQGVYGHFNDGELFAFFGKAVLNMLPKIEFCPDVIHLHDWHSGPIAFMLKNQVQNQPFYQNIKTLYTIHNLQYQGLFGVDLLDKLGIDRSFFTSEQLEFYGQFNFMKTGIVYSDVINTVSQQYSKEILTKEYGENLEGVLKGREEDLYGIVNGIGEEVFSPEFDPYLRKHFDYTTTEIKKEIKDDLRQMVGLPHESGLLIGIVHRLVDQKGLDLIIPTLEKLLPTETIQLIVLGLGDPRYQEQFFELEKQYPNKVKCFFEFNEKLAHYIYAGSDIFLMPSKFEPCGLGQMIAMAYGTLPLVRSTGGLADTVIDIKEKNGNGFVFTEYEEDEFHDTMLRVLDIYFHDRDQWDRALINAMKEDNRWEQRALEYVELYKKCMNK